MATKEEIEAYLAKGKTITKLPKSRSNNIGEREWQQIVRGESFHPVAKLSEAQLRLQRELEWQAESDAEQDREVFHGAIMSGASQETAMDDLNFVRMRRNQSRR